MFYKPKKYSNCAPKQSNPLRQESHLPAVWQPPLEVFVTTQKPLDHCSSGVRSVTSFIPNDPVLLQQLLSLPFPFLRESTCRQRNVNMLELHALWVSVSCPGIGMYKRGILRVMVETYKIVHGAERMVREEVFSFSHSTRFGVIL